MSNTAEVILAKSRRKIMLPHLGVNVEVRALRTRQMLEAGIMPLIKVRPDEVESDSEESVQSVLRAARELLVACAVLPRIYASDDYRGSQKGNISIDDIPDDDVLYAYGEIVKISDSRFYGINHNAFDAENNQALLDGQMKVSILIDAIARWYGISPIEILNEWSNEDISTVWAIIEVAKAEMEKVAASGK